MRWFGALLIALPAVAGAATYQVGQGRPHATLPALFSAVDLGAGDIVEVDGNQTYAGDIVMPSADGGAPGNPVVLRGVPINNNRPRLNGGVNTIEFRLVNHVVFEGFEVTGTTTPTRTFRCVYHHGHDLTIRNAVIHDCPDHGVLGSDQDSGSITIEYSHIYNAGSAGSHHALYIATDEVARPGSVFRLQYNYIHDSNYNNGAEGGNLIKSRAERNEIYYNWLEGAYYHELELIGPDPDGAPDGWSEGLKREDSDVVGNVIVHTSAFGAVIRAGGDATGQSYGRYRFLNNTIVRFNGSNDVPTVFRLFDGIESIEMHNNVLWRDGSSAVRVIREVEADWSTGVSRITGSNNWIESGSTFVPANWAILGTVPGFVSPVLATIDLRLQAGSALRNTGANNPITPPGYEFPNTLVAATRQPPLRQLIAPGSAAVRPTDGAIDIGAFELGDPDLIFRDGFQ